MKKFTTGTFFIIGGLIVFILGIVFNSTWMFLLGLAILIITLSIEFGIFKKDDNNDNGDSEDDTTSYEVNEAEVKDNVLYLH